MEAAGWECARACRGLTAVVAGTGNNGGDALAAARHLHRWGRLHSVSCLDRDRLGGMAAARARALELAGVAIAPAPQLAGAETVLDGVFGIGLNRPVQGPAATWIEAINASGAHVVAVDVPSGIDADSGEVLGVAVRAAVTVTFGLAKPGLLAGAGAELAGEVRVVDIGVPAAAYARALR